MNFFHCDVNIYKSRAKNLLVSVSVPVIPIAAALMVYVSLALCGIFTDRYIGIASVILAVAAVAFAVICVIVCAVTKRRIGLHSKYTYAEIGEKDIIISLYAGQFRSGKKRTMLRRLIVVPLAELETVRVLKSGKILAVAKSAAIRDYVSGSERLGYYFVDGTLNFSEFYFTEKGFAELQRVTVPRLFESELLVEAIWAAKERFDAVPPPKPYVFEEMPHVKLRKMRERVRRMRGF